MNFTIAFQHRRAAMFFLIKAERDDIFIALPKWKGKKEEAIFLTRNNRQWVGDSSDKKLVERIGREIDEVCKRSSPSTRIPSRSSSP